jgi:hypothetical protein
MDIKDLVKEIRRACGEKIVVELGSCSLFRLSGLEPPTVLSVTLTEVESFFELHARKTRSYKITKPSPGGYCTWYGSERFGTVYAISSKQDALRTQHAKGNYRTVYHGTGIANAFNILKHGFKPSTSPALLLGNGGVYVGSYSKAMSYVKGVNIPITGGFLTRVHGSYGRVGRFRRTDYSRNRIDSYTGVIFKLRADLGSVCTVKDGDGANRDYSVVNQKHDTLYARRGSSLGGVVWGGSLRESEFVVKPEQLVIEEVHFLHDREPKERKIK